MVILEKREIEQNNALRLIKTGGYLVLLGIFIGVTLGAYTLFNPPLFSIFNNISHFEARSFFLCVYLPSFITIVAIGYVFATIPKRERFNLWRTAVLCSLVLLSLALSALSALNILSFLGMIIILITVSFIHTEPTFKVFWKREACFFVETGTILIASSYMLFLLMLLISGFFQTYSAGVYEISFSYPYLLLLMTIFSLMTFVLTPFLCLRGTNVGLCGIIGLTMGVLSFITMIKNQYVYLSLSVYQGIFLASIGIILTFTGVLIHFKLFFSEIIAPTLEHSFLYKGKYCPFCGEHWVNANKVLCSTCKRNLFWKSEKPFCPYCGRLVIQDVKNCPHCGEYVVSLPVYISPKKLEEEKLLREIGKPGTLQKAFYTLLEYFDKAVDRIGLSLKEFIYICILTFLFVFLSFIVYVRTEVVSVEVLEYSLVFSHYGFPIEWLEVVTMVNHIYNVGVMWTSLVLTFMFYSLLAFVLVHESKKLFYAIQRRFA